MSKLKINKSEIRISTFEDKLSKTTFNLFREWTKNAMIYHPKLDFTIKDERILIKDFRDDLKGAILSLLENKKYQSGNFLPQWDYGYICGFIGGSLNTHWYNEYITKKTDDYKVYASLKVLTSYFEFDKNLENNLDKLYEYFLENKSNSSSINFETVKKDINIEKRDIKAINTDETGKIKTVLENLTIKYILKMAEEKPNSDYIDSVTDYISYQSFVDLIDENKFSLKYV